MNANHFTGIPSRLITAPNLIDTITLGASVGTLALTPAQSVNACLEIDRDGAAATAIVVTLPSIADVAAYIGPDRKEGLSFFFAIRNADVQAALTLTPNSEFELNGSGVTAVSITKNGNGVKYLCRFTESKVVSRTWW